MRRRFAFAAIVLLVVAMSIPQAGLAQGNSPPNPPNGAPAIGGAAFGSCIAGWTTGTITVFGVPLGQFLQIVGINGPIGTPAQAVVTALKAGVEAIITTGPCP